MKYSAILKNNWIYLGYIVYWEKKGRNRTVFEMCKFYIFSIYVCVYVYIVCVYILQMKHVFVCIVHLLAGTKEADNSSNLWKTEKFYCITNLLYH